MPVYKQFDQAALNYQYNLRAQVPDFAVYLDKCESLSRETETALHHIKDLPYGILPREKLDIYPSQSPSSKTLVFIHGGYWQRFGKADFQFVAKAFHDYGLTTVLMEYPLAPEFSMDQMVASCRQALGWLVQNLSKYNGDPAQIYLAGHSAGAHLAAMMLTGDGKNSVSPNYDLIRGAILISGIYNLEPVRLSHINDVLRLNREEALRNSPVHQKPATHCPVSLIAGGDEGLEFLDQSRELFSCWKENIPAECIIIQGVNHYSILETMLDPESPLHGAMVQLMKLK